MNNSLNNALRSSSTMVGKFFQTDYDRFDLEPYLVIVSGSQQGKHFKLDRRQNIFGRDQDSDIVISDPKISRQHGAISLTNDGIFLEDLNSSNGTFIDGKRITKGKIELLHRIQAGDTQMKIDYKTRREAQLELELYQAATMDSLTAILNRGAFMGRADQEFAFCKRNGEILTIVMCDADYFKQKNDNFGHLAGDKVLKELADILVKAMRVEDVLARYGGEEFIMLLRETPQTAAGIWAERIRNTIMQYPFTFNDQPIPTTVSIGICSRRADTVDSLQTIIQAADDALYRAKQNGRNRVEIA